MNIFNVLAGFASIASLLFAGFVYHRDRVRREQVAAATEVLRERLRRSEPILRAAGTNIEILISSLDQSEGESVLPNLARAVRTDIFAGLLTLEETWEMLDEWRFGGMLESLRLRQTEGNRVSQADSQGGVPPDVTSPENTP